MEHLLRYFFRPVDTETFRNHGEYERMFKYGIYRIIKFLLCLRRRTDLGEDLREASTADTGVTASTMITP